MMLFRGARAYTGLALSTLMHNINVNLDNLISEMNANSATEFSAQTFHSMKIILSGHYNL